MTFDEEVFGNGQYGLAGTTITPRVLALSLLLFRSSGMHSHSDHVGRHDAHIIDHLTMTQLQDLLLHCLISGEHAVGSTRTQDYHEIRGQALETAKQDTVEHVCVLTCSSTANMSKKHSDLLT